MLAAERPLVSAAEQEKVFGEVDGARVDGVKSVDELAGIAAEIFAGDVEKCLRIASSVRIRGGAGRESLLFCNVRFEAREHGVEAVCELTELVPATFRSGAASG